MRLDGGDRVPADARAGRVVALEVVGVELDQTGDQPVAVEVDAGSARTGIVDRGDRAAADDDVAIDDLAGQDDASIAEYGLGHGFGSGKINGVARQIASDHEFAQLL